MSLDDTDLLNKLTIITSNTIGFLDGYLTKLEFYEKAEPVIDIWMNHSPTITKAPQ